MDGFCKAFLSCGFKVWGFKSWGWASWFWGRALRLLALGLKPLSSALKPIALALSYSGSQGGAIVEIFGFRILVM